LVLSYIHEAIENTKSGKKIKPTRTKRLIVPSELEHAFKKDAVARVKFDALKPGQKREFAEYIAEAKRSDTKIRRLEKILPMIKSDVGLNDKYK
jgi:uncharacterized protein YdeI (YjbR/CyaY-like superfamily)